MRNPVARKRFEEVLDIEEGESVNQMWEKTWDILLKATEKVSGWTKGHARHIQTWWWSEEVRAVTEMKKVKFREWQKTKASPEEEVKLKEYVEARKEAKKAVAKAQQKERERFGERFGHERLDAKKDKDLYIE